ncbi:KdsC family phosphatase [Candidatus Omnitrophota bacterium]
MMDEKKPEIRIAFFDVDGVLTDGTKSYYQDGTVSKVFHDQDSYGLKQLKNAGVEVYLISEDKRVNQAWAEYQKIPFLLSKDKVVSMSAILKEKGYSPAEAAYIGDEIRDLGAMKLVKYSIAPKNAVKRVKKVAWKVLQRTGGQGAVREAAEIIIKINSGESIEDGNI